MGRGGACCASDADIDNGDENRVEDLDEETKAKAQEKLDKDNEYEPSGSGRIPGSKYTISEVDVLGADDQNELEKVVTKHAESSRGESSCCGGTSGILAEWKWVASLEDAADEIR